MQVQQKHVTFISLSDGRERDLLLLPDGCGYRLSLVSRDELVHIQLSSQDLKKLREMTDRAERNSSAWSSTSEHLQVSWTTTEAFRTSEAPASPRRVPEWIAFN
jgi:hypothetical protein